MAVVEFRDVWKRYGHEEAVRGITWDIPDGQFFCILGPSGCGKSSLLRMTGGLEEVSDGRILVDGREVQDVPARDRNMAMVFEAFALYPHLSVWENVAFPLRIRRVAPGEIRRRVEWALELVDLGGLARRNVRQLSEGQKQRTSLARAIVRAPVVFLLDEPVSHVEARLRAHLRGEIVKLHRELRVTTLYVTHDQSEALSMADRIAVMRQGRFLQVGEPDDVYLRPRTVEVASFVGEPPMNFLHGELMEEPSGPVFRTDGVAVSVHPAPGQVLARRRGPVILGVRPEDLELAGAEAGGIPARVSVLESQGDATFVFADSVAGLLQVEVPPDAEVAEGQRLTLVPRAGAVHLYEEENGETLLREAAGG